MTPPVTGHHPGGSGGRARARPAVFAAILTAAFALLAPAAGAAQAPFTLQASGPVQVGFGMADITPDFPVVLSYGRPDSTTGFYDRAMVNALLVQVADARALLLEFDVIGIRRRDADYIAGRVARAVGLDPRQVIVGATHNHSYPRTHDETVRELMADRAVDAARRAQASRFDARIGVGRTMAREDLNLNRAELDGIANPILYVLRVDDADGHLRGAMFNYGTHATIFTEWSDVGQTGPDWPGFVRQYVQARTRLDLLYTRYQQKNDISTDPVILYSGGAAGDQQPRRSDIRLRGEDAPPKLVFMEKLADDVLALIHDTETRRDVDMTLRWAATEVRRRDGGAHQTQLQALVLNDAVLATIPGELGVDLAYDYDAASPFEKNVLITNAGDYIGYIVPEDLAIEEVTYQSKGVRFDPHYGVQLIDDAVRLIDPGHTDAPRLRRDTLLGSIAGTVCYDGDNVVAIGVRRIPAWPNYGGGFWGQRTVADADGHWTIDDLAPGTFYVYVAEADPDNPGPTREKSGYRDLRTLAYGYPVTVRAGEETGGIHFDLPGDLLDTDVAGIALDPGSLALEGNTLTGALRVDGRSADETVQVGLYAADVPYRKRERYLAHPALRTAAADDGTFRFDSVPPGRWRVVAILDVNDNGLVELRGIDLVTRLGDSPILSVPGREGAAWRP